MPRFFRTGCVAALALLASACMTEPPTTSEPVPEQTGEIFSVITVLSEDSILVGRYVETDLKKFYPSGIILGYAASDTSIVTISGSCASFETEGDVSITATYADSTTVVRHFPVKDFSGYFPTGIASTTGSGLSCQDVHLPLAHARGALLFHTLLVL